VRVMFSLRILNVEIKGKLNESDSYVVFTWEAREDGLYVSSKTFFSFHHLAELRKEDLESKIFERIYSKYLELRELKETARILLSLKGKEYTDKDRLIPEIKGGRKE